MLTVILTGGSSRRMGRDKAALPFEGSTFLQTLIDRYADFGPVFLAVNKLGRFPYHGATEYPDVYPGMGPLNGIVSGFRHSDEEELFLTAVDLPYGDPALARKLSMLRGSADACVIRTGPKGIEPLFSIYGRRCLSVAEECLNADRRSVQAMLDLVDTRYVEPNELTGFCLERVLTNINSPDDYMALR